MSDQLTGAEAIYGFIGWLTSRDKTTIMSSKHDASKPVDLIAEFCETNSLSDPREDWTKNLTRPI